MQEKEDTKIINEKIKVSMLAKCLHAKSEEIY